MLHINAKGIRGAKMDSMSAISSETEVLFGSNARFQVQKVVKKKDDYVIYMTEVS